MNGPADVLPATAADVAPLRAVVRDPALPQLAAALDATRMGALLAGLVADAGGGGAVESCRIERVKHRRGRNASVLYRLAFGEGDTQLFHAGVFGAAEARRRFSASLGRVTLPRRGLPVAHLPALAMVVWAFPNDRKLPGLPLLADAPRLADELLPAVLAERWGCGAALADCAVEPVAYFPEHACTARVALRVADGAGGRPWQLYAKTDAGGRGAATLAAMRRLWQSPARRDGRFAMARPLLFQPAAAMLWQEALAGTPVAATAGAAALAPALARRIGETLAGLHGVAPVGLPRFDGGLALARLGAASRALAEAFPELAGRLAALGTTLARERPVDAAADATLHGDLHLNNVLDDGERIGFVDFDDLASGPPAAELGSFVAGLIYRAALHRQDAGASAEAIAAFHAGHAACSALAVPWQDLRWYAAAALVHERAWRCLTSLKPGRLALVHRLVGMAAALVRSGGRGGQLERVA